MHGQEPMLPISRFGKNKRQRSTSYPCTFGVNSLPVSHNQPSVPAGRRKPPNSSRRFKLYSPTLPTQISLNNGKKALSPLRARALPAAPATNLGAWHPVWRL